MTNPLKKIAWWWRGYLKRLAQVNQEEFGGRPPSCCDPKPVRELGTHRQKQQRTQR